MIDGLPVPLLNGIGVVGVVLVVGYWIARGHLVTKPQHEAAIRWRDDALSKVEKERDEWRGMALRSLGVAERITGPVEVVADVMQRLPDPASEEEMS